MKYETFFNRLLSKICHKLGIGVIEIEHAKDKVRCNGRERLVTWIDAYDKLLSARDRQRVELTNAARRLIEIESSISEVEKEMTDKKVIRCPACEGVLWTGERSLKGHGTPCLEWTDCPKCSGKGVVKK